jgi:hypothetical protein
VHGKWCLIVSLTFGVILALQTNNIVRQPVAIALEITSPSAVTAKISEGPRLPMGRGSHAGGVINGHIMIVGGTSWNQERTKKSFLNDSLVFDDNAWQPGPSIDAPLAEGAFADDGHALYLAGGLSGPNQPRDLVLRITQNGAGKFAAQKLPSLPLALSASGAAIINHRLYLACGTFLSGKSTNRVWSLDLKNSSAPWREQAPLPAIGRAYPAVVACGNFIYLLGGLDDAAKSVHERTLCDVYQYDPASDRWKSLGNLPFPGYCWSAQPIDDTRLLLAGRADGLIHDEVWLVHLPDLSAQLLGHTVLQATCAPLMKAGPNTWWLVGGEPDSQKNRTNRVSIITLR